MGAQVATWHYVTLGPSPTPPFCSLQSDQRVICFENCKDSITFRFTFLQLLPAITSKLITRTCATVGQDPSRVNRLETKVLLPLDLRVSSTNNVAPHPLEH